MTTSGIDTLGETPSGELPTDDFVSLFSRYQRRLFLYILTQVPHPVDAEEILQETSVVIWRKAAQFQPGTNFFAWVSQVANFEVMKYRSRRKREKLQFSDEFIAQVATEAVARADELELRRNALLHCIEKLRPQDRELIQQRYAPGETGKNLAESKHRPANSVYQSLGRIRRTLWECIQRQLAVES
ncbi:MAG: sigma-70 family RNA polymerase sigma factor [Planctomycetaceae bacterium]|nr:sigma-70 family RNA polymerase sigma factor [Planctomycetaceae bacterium]